MTGPGQSQPIMSNTTKVEVLTTILSLAQLFSTCVEAFNLIHPLKDSDKAQRVALARLGLQQGRLLIFGDAVGISSPPASIATSMVPTNPGATNPDPELPIYFGVRDPRLDDANTQERIRAALTEIAGRPNHLTREEAMEKYGLKSAKRFGMLAYPSLDTNRLEAFREKFGLLQDLAHQSGVSPATSRGMSMTTQHWTVKEVEKFDAFVHTVKEEVDGLIALMGVKEHIDRGMKSDIKALAWHPELSAPVIRSDLNKLRLIKEACVKDYPEYVEATEIALKYINEEMRETSAELLRAAYSPARRRSEDDGRQIEKDKEREREKAKGVKSGREKTASFLSGLASFTFKARPDRAEKEQRQPEMHLSVYDETLDPARSNSGNFTKSEGDTSMPIQSKSLSDLPRRDELGGSEEKVQTNESGPVKTKDVALPPADMGDLVRADTANSFIERHDLFRGVGRVETKDIRAVAKAQESK